MLISEKLVEKILSALIEKFGVKMGDADYAGPGVPDEGDIRGGIYAKKKKSRRLKR